MTIPLTTPLPTQLQPPTRTCWSKRSSAALPRKAQTARGPYLALLPVGLAMPPLLPAARWALTPPFHPYLPTLQSKQWNDRRFIFCGAFRRVAPPGRYPAPFLFGVRTFLPVGCPTKRPSSLPRKGAPILPIARRSSPHRGLSKRRVVIRTQWPLRRRPVPQAHCCKQCCIVRWRRVPCVARHGPEAVKIRG